MTVYIDADLPFTEAEVRRALALVVPAAQARQLAREIALLPAETAAATKEAEAARLRGSTDPREINSPSWDVSDEIFALLACVSDSLAARVDQHMERRWRAWTQDLIRSEMLFKHGGAGAEPPREVVSRARRKVGSWKAAWTRRRRRVEREVQHRDRKARGGGGSGGSKSRMEEASPKDGSVGAADRLS